MTDKELKVLKDNLWHAADVLRSGAHLAANKYGQPILGLFFLRYADILFKQHKDEIDAQYTKRLGIRMEKTRKEIAVEKCGFFLPECAYYDFLNDAPDTAEKADLVKKAMEAIERENPKMDGVLPKEVYARWTGSFAEHQISKYLLYSAAIIRKMIEDELDAKNEFQNSEYGIPELAMLHYELPATEYPFDGDKDFILHKVVADYYNAGSRNVTVQAKTICNSIIHSYVQNLAYSEGKRETAGFLTAPDREKNKKLYFVKISDWIGYINYCKEKCNV